MYQLNLYFHLSAEAIENDEVFTSISNIID